LPKNQPTYIAQTGMWFYLGDEIFKQNAFTSALDCGKIVGVDVRTRRSGDRIFWNSVGTKKIKDYFIDKKIPRDVRDTAVFVATDGDIILILDGFHKSDKFTPTADSKIIYLQIWEGDEGDASL